MAENLIPKDFIRMGGRTDQYLHTTVKIFKRAGPEAFLFEINGKLVGPFTRNELQCFKDSIMNDMEL